MSSDNTKHSSFLLKNLREHLKLVAIIITIFVGIVYLIITLPNLVNPEPSQQPEEPISENKVHFVEAIIPKDATIFVSEPKVKEITDIDSYLELLLQQLSMTSDDTERKKLESIIDWWIAASAHYKNMEFEEAIPYYEKILEIEPTNVNTLDHIALAHARLDRTEDSIRYYDRLLTIIPDYYVAIINKGWSYALLEQYNDALEEFKKLEKDNPDDLLVLAHECWTLHKLKQHTDAISYCKRVIDAGIEDLRVIKAYSLSLSLEERHQEALQYHEQLYQKDPKELSTLINYANTLSKVDKYEEALKIYLEANEMVKDHPVILHNLRILCTEQPQLECDIP